MSETRARRSGGRAARQAARMHAHVERVPFLTRTLAPVEVLGEEGLATIEENAERILQEVGIEFHDAPDALELFAGAGADVDGERVRFPAGLCRSLVRATARQRNGKANESTAPIGRCQGLSGGVYPSISLVAKPASSSRRCSPTRENARTCV